MMFENYDDSARLPQMWKRAFRSSFEIIYTFAEGRFDDENQPIIRLLKADEGSWGLNFIVKEGQILKESKKRFTLKQEAIDFSHKLMRDFNTGQIDNYIPIRPDGVAVDNPAWSNLKRKRDELLGRTKIKMFLW